MGGVPEVAMQPANPNPGLPSQNVLGHLLGALDDDEQQQIERRLEQDPEYARALAYWQRRLAWLQASRLEYEPPPDLAAHACHCVAAHKLIASHTKGMIPVLSPPSWIAPTRWLDVSVVVLLFVAAAAVIFPAICDSRFHSRRATCQNGLRQFGLAVAERSQLRGEAVSEAAAVEYLKPVGKVSAAVVPGGLLSRLPEVLSPDAEALVQNALRTRWPHEDGLPQGMLRTVAFAKASAQDQRPAARRVMCISDRMAPESSSSVDAWLCNAGATSCAVLADSADATAAISNDAVDVPGGQAWNVLFEDCHVDFLSQTLPQELASMFFEDAPFWVGSILEPLSK